MMQLFKKLIYLIKSFFICNKEVKKKHKFLKKNFIKDQHKYIWQVVDYDKYPQKRCKNLVSTKLIAGLFYTSSFLLGKDDFYKVLIITTDDIEKFRLNIDISVYDTVLLIQNIGLDIGAHRSGLELMSNEYEKDISMPMILSNSSFIPKVKSSIFKILDRTLSNISLIGCSYGVGPKYYIMKKLHIQTFFLVSNYSNFTKIFQKLNLYNNNKMKIIRDGELKISQIAIEIGLKLVIYDGFVFRIFNDIIQGFKSYDHRLCSINKNSF